MPPDGTAWEARLRRPGFHNFNVCFRDDATVEVVAFTATQIPHIEERRYPAALAGSLYPKGVPIYPEEDLPRLIQEHQVDEVVFAYSDVSYEYVGGRAAQVLAGGADFVLLGPTRTMLSASVPVIAVTAVRTGSGKSQTTRRIAAGLKDLGKAVVVVRHPMPYGDLLASRVQRFSTAEDLDRFHCTIEEREEYEPHLERGVVVYAGVDYAAILQEAQKEAEILVWDGGNNDLPFIRPDLHIVIVDPHRAGDEVTYYPGEANLRRADVVVINKVDTAPVDGLALVRENIQRVNPGAPVIEAASPITVDEADQVRGKRVLVVEDGPTLTHGDMAYGAAWLAAHDLGAQVVDPRPFAVGSIQETFQRFPHLHDVLPAMGYGEEQVAELEETINAAKADAVLSGTPVDLGKIVRSKKPILRVRYKLEEMGTPTLKEILEAFLAGLS